MQLDVVQSGNNPSQMITNTVAVQVPFNVTLLSQCEVWLDHMVQLMSDVLALNNNLNHMHDLLP